MASTQVNGASSHLARWAERLKNLTVSPLTRDFPERQDGDEARQATDARESLDASQDVRNALEKLRSLASPFHLLLTAYVLLVSRLTGDEDIAIGTNSKVDEQPFVLRLPVASKEAFSELATKVQSNVADCADDIVPLQDIRSHLKSRNLFRFAAFQTSGSGDTTECDETTDLQLDVSITSNGGMRITAIYNPSLFSNARIAITLTQLFQIIQDASTDPSQPVGAIDLLTPTQRKLLPDPTRDLGWSDFRGAIHDIFSRNAEAHPERPCVVETRAGGTPERSFTYKQINEASNILGHLLVKSGIQRGDVVMIYSHRGVDLVVTVMGILKAGATFSVLDPAYPPDRQNVYLEVAKPSALVVIAKATQEAGEISETVRAFISANLKLRIEVPGLALRGDGSLIGGDVAGRDVLASVEHLGASSLGIVVGPDSTPTLSFTSGSEGKPKGVRGRHFSLAYYFDWMAKTFKLSENDRFTMLSGIAHDPIQRDVFTPLFLGAQLLVPSRDDIQNERLAEWMKEHGATVTHLTPAMGQILVGGASAVFEKLHHAFFVGDILIKRDCRALQDLAPNVCIVNMYGTTETQRAVSYFEIPSYASDKNYLAGMKDVIPAGKGMFNVQLLVVNRYDPTKLCAIGEVGEIYVRAGGLAEGYLGTPELTEKKFVKNWFVDPEQWVKEYEAKKASSASCEPWQEFYFGPRDRLYRSGDLGRYTPTGDVECSGRADDQVKIRGFRIELGEIDTHLSRHPLVLQNVTLVRRDMNEEHTLVSYVVPDMAAWKSFLQTEGLEDQHDNGTLASRFQRFRLLQREVQAYLKTKLAAYAVPSVILPMELLPLNPNGKVDKPKLPFPDVSMVGAHRRQSSIAEDLSDLEKSLAQIWSRVVPGLIPRTIRPDDSFTDLGGTSMHAQQLPFNIRREWKGADITMGEVIRNPKLRDMAASIERVLAGGANDVRPSSEIAYGEDALTLPLPQRFLPAAESKSASPVVFLTGVTGFLGAYILRDLFERTPNFRVAALVRAKTKEAALDRIKTTCEAYGIWSDSWPSRLLCIPGSLDKSRFGMTDKDWEMLVEDTDIVIHNGAEVHWGKTYETLKPTNVLGTLEALKLCEQAKPRSFVFVSSTSVLDTEHYVRVSENRTKSGLNGISETDDLQGSRQGLGTGYGQSKWVAEYIVREAGNRGLRGGIVRPGYVLGDSSFGVTNTDDFLIRMLKACIQLSGRPDISNTVNMVPVDHVARVVVACALYPQVELSVAHVTGHPRLTFNQFLAALETYGYKVPPTGYEEWTAAVQSYVDSTKKAGRDQLAVMGLLEFVMKDLPSNTRAPELEDFNTKRALRFDRKQTGQDMPEEPPGVTEATIGLYLAYLVAIGFLPPPSSNGKKALPVLKLSDEQKRALAGVGGRGRRQ